ncbi:MAG: ABC transporter ATP-binding protein/permease [Lachnospiraceae bacterium]|nr:ABC transporter ATP-binding protein/permease [Lachnospiraceae bacterium]
MEKSYENIKTGHALKVIFSRLGEFKRASFLTPVAMVFEVIMEMLIPLLMSSIIDKGVGEGDMGHIYKIGIFMMIAALGGLFAGAMGAKYSSMAGAGLARNLRKAMYENIQTFSFSNIDKYSTSGLVTRLTTDVTNIQNAYQMVLRACMRAPSTLVVAIFLSFSISPRLANVYVIAVIFLGIFIFFLMSRVTKYFQKVFEKYDELNESVEENVSGIRVVKAFVREDYEKKRFSRAAENIYNMFVKAEDIMVTGMPVMQLTIYSCILAISYLGARLIVNNELTTGQLMSLLAYCLNILMSLMMLSMVFVMVSMSQASVKRVTEVIEEKADIVSPENGIKDVKDGTVCFRNVHFAYGDDVTKRALSDINIEIRSGETIGIIGRTGSGKSTLVSLISRLYDATIGEVLVGGVNVKDYDLEVLRDAVSVVLQKNELFSGTIYDNLRWGKEDATEEECREAARLSCADEFINRMSDGYNTRIEQGGSNVSGGQRQRLCIARALLKSPKILVLDDSTSAVDTATDAKIQKGFREFIPETTKIIIAQRISSVQNADRIIVLENGEISGFDTHENLVRDNEIYRDIYESQTSDADFDEKGGEA